MSIWKKYSLGIVLIVLFLASWVVMTWTDWVYFVGQEAEHHQPAEVFGASGYIWQWGVDTFSNWQADFLGETMGVVLGAYLLFRGSEESKDPGDEVQDLVLDVERRVRGSDAAQGAQGATRSSVYRGGNLRNYGLGYTLLAGFLVSLALMTWMGWMYFASDAKEHGETAQWFGTSGYIWEWLRETMSNWQSDALGRGVLVILPAYLLYKGSAQSREGIDRVKVTLGRVQQALQAQETGGAEAGTTVRETRRVGTSTEHLSLWGKYGLAIPFVAVFVIGLILQTWSGWEYFVGLQLQHHQTAEVFGPSGYFWLWGDDTFSNWQSDLLWAGVLVIMAAYLIYRGSAESKDTDDRIENLANSIESRVRGQEVARRDQAATDREMSRGGIWRNRGLAYSLIAAGIISWVLMTWTGWINFSADQKQHGSVAEVFGASGYIWQWARLTFENWQSDIMGNAATLFLSTYLLYRGSGVSRGSDDETEAALQRIQKALREGGSKTGKPATQTARTARDNRVQQR